MGILFYAQACIRKPAADAILGRAASRGKIFSTRSYRLKWNAHVSLIFKGKTDILCRKEWGRHDAKHYNQLLQHQRR